MEPDESVGKRFVVDNMLGKVAKWLRVLGYDARCERLAHKEQLDRYSKEGFLIVTRNRRWCGHSRVICLSENDPMEQLRELFSGIAISPGEIHLLHRCILCNQLLEPLSREEAFGRVPDYVFETNVTFYQCPCCRRVFWSGSHPKRMVERLHRILGWTF